MPVSRVFLLMKQARFDRRYPLHLLPHKVISLNRRLKAIAVMLVVAPLAVGMEPADRDSSVTRFTVGFGTGSYADVARGCNGELISATGRKLQDSGVAVEHQTPGGVAFGLRASRFNLPGQADPDGGTTTWNPHLAYEGNRAGVGLGVVIRPRALKNGAVDFNAPPLSGHFRVGPRDRGGSITFSLFENVPAYSPGGIGEVNISVRPTAVVGGSIGLAAPGPFDNVGLLLRCQVRAGRNFDIALRGRLGSSAGLGETTIGAGLTYRWVHR